MSDFKLSHWKLTSHLVKVELCIYSIKECRACDVLNDALNRVLSRDSAWVNNAAFVNSKAYIIRIRPRVFPTVIAFVGAVPVLGWEGLADMQCEQSQDTEIMDIISQIEHFIEQQENQTTNNAIRDRAQRL